HLLYGRSNPQRVNGQPDEMLKDNSMIDSFGQRFTPGKSTMPGHERCGTRQGITDGQGFRDHPTSIQLVIAPDLACSQQPRAGYGAVEIIGMRGSQRGQLAAALGPGRGSQTVRMDDAADPGKGAVKLQMRRGVRTGLELAFDHASRGQGDNNH